MVVHNLLIRTDFFGVYPLDFHHKLKGDSRDPQHMGSGTHTMGHESHSHFRIPKDMGMVWVPLTIKGVPLLGVPEKFPYKLRRLLIFAHFTTTFFFFDTTATA